MGLEEYKNTEFFSVLNNFVLETLIANGKRTSLNYNKLSYVNI